MTIRYKQGFTEKIVEVDYLEIEDAKETEVKNGKWVFKDEFSNGTY